MTPMASERDKASEQRLKWWYFRPWSPIFVGAVVGWFVFSPAPVGSSLMETVLKAYAWPLIGVIVGAAAGILFEWFLRAARAEK